MATKNAIYELVKKEIARKDLEFKRNGQDFMILVAKNAAHMGVPMWQGGSGKGQGRPPSLDNSSKVWVLWCAYKKHGTVASPNRVKKDKIVKVVKKPKKQAPLEDDIEDYSDNPPPLMDADATEPEVQSKAVKRPRENSSSDSAASASSSPDAEHEFNRLKLVEHFKKMIKYANLLGENITKEQLNVVQSVLNFPARLS